MPRLPDKEREQFVMDLMARHIPEDQIPHYLDLAEGVDSLTTNDANPYSPGLPEAADSTVELTKDPLRWLARRVPTIIGAIAGNAGGGKLIDKIPALAGVGLKEALGRIGLRAGGEAVGAGGGDLIGQALAGDQIDPGKAGMVGMIQGGLGLLNSGTAAGLGKAGGVGNPAIEGAMGRPDFAKAPAPAEYGNVVRQIHAGFEPTSPGRVDLESTIDFRDNQKRLYIEGGKFIDAMERGLPSGSSPENMAARSKLLGEIENHRRELERLAQMHQVDPVRVLGAPAVNIPGEKIVTPETRIPAVPPQEIPQADAADYLGGPAKSAPLRMQGAPETVIPGAERMVADVNIAATPEQMIPPNLQAAEGRALGRVPKEGAGNLRLPLTARQADDFIRRNLTAPIAEDLAGNPGGTEYAGARKAMRGRVAGEFYDQLGFGAGGSAQRAKDVLDVKDLVADRYFPVDERGVPKPASAGRIAAVGRNNSPEDAIYREHLTAIDDALGSNLVAIADRLAQKQEWSPNDQREAAFLLDAYRATSGRVVTTGGFRGFMRWIGRTALRSQGKVGAAVRGAATGAAADYIRPDKEKRRIGPTP